jgi:hypothetical protein
MENPNISDSHLVTNEMQVNLHILRPLMLNRIGEEVHGVDVVAIDKRALGERAMKLSQELLEPGRLSHAVSNSMVLRLSTRAREPVVAWMTRISGCRRGRQHNLR